MRPTPPLIAAASVALLGTAVFGLVTRDDPATSTSATPGEVQIVGFKYAPEVVEVAAGTTVTWTNEDEAAHTVDSADGDDLDSGNLAQGDAFEHTFEVAGTFEYVCKLHPFMNGTVEVTG